MSRFISFADLSNADLHLGATYKGGTIGNIASEPISKVLPVGNAGGFRKVGKGENPKLVALFTSLREKEWPDSIDELSGILTYYGDNRVPGRDLHATKPSGNAILRKTFQLRHGDSKDRLSAPVFLLFVKGRDGYDQIFQGLLVPGTEAKDPENDLVAIWKGEGEKRFQNYRAKFTILNSPIVSLNWLEDIIDSKDKTRNAPQEYLDWVFQDKYTSISSSKIAKF